LKRSLLSSTLRGLLLLFACALGWTATGCSDRVSPELLAQVRRGAASTEFRASAVDVPLVGGKDRPLVEVTLNGKGPYRFLLDAGGNVVTLKRSVAVAVGATPLRLREARDVVRLESLDLGGATFHQVVAVAEPELDVDGVLGFNVFTRGLLTLDYPAQRLTWTPAGTLPRGTGQESIMTYELRDRMPYVPLHLGAETLWFNLDTGATRSFYLPARMQERFSLAGPVTEGPRLWNQATGSFSTRQGRLARDLRLGPHTFERPVVVFSTNTEELLLGSGALKDFVVTFDLGQRRVRLLRTA
jgi:hypothetical protein